MIKTAEVYMKLVKCALHTQLMYELDVVRGDVSELEVFHHLVCCVVNKETNRYQQQK